MRTITLDNLRGISMSSKSTVDLHVVRHIDHWALQIDQSLLLDARDDVRTFRTLDAVASFVRRHVVPYGATCRVILVMHSGLDL